MKNHIEIIGQFVGARINRLGLLVWPTIESLRETDVQLHIEVQQPNRKLVEFTVSTSPDGQTPQVEFENWANGFQYSQLTERQKLWKSEQFWTDEHKRSYELFETANEAVSYTHLTLPTKA